MKINKSILFAALLFNLALFGNSAQANEFNVHTVPASNCEPTTEDAAAKVYLSANSWRFRGTNTGSVGFYCSIPLNHNASTTSANELWNYRVFYRDSDGAAGSSRISSYFMTRAINGSTFWSGYKSSNSFVNTANTTYTVFMNTEIPFERLGAIYVSMYRANTSQSPAFSGVDFNKFIIF